ncbi:MAG: pyridoxamine 5'-phosphate oxidase, partial [Nitrospirota bacterium]
EDDPALLKHLTDSRYKGKPERVIRFHVEAWDVNCRQHIPKKYSEEDLAGLVQPLRDRLVTLEAENAMLTRQFTLPVSSPITTA